jgi:hypothetical protein
MHFDKAVPRRNFQHRRAAFTQSGESRSRGRVDAARLRPALDLAIGAPSSKLTDEPCGIDSLGTTGNEETHGESRKQFEN